MPNRPAVKFPLLLSLNIALLLVLGASPVNASAPVLASTSFLPIVQSEWTPPCGGVPKLISPADGSQVNPETLIVLDGGYREDTNDWLEYGFSQTPDFRSWRGGYLQPAGKRWELRLGNYHLEPGKWYWRASIWCHGPGWPPPPEGYEQSPYTQVWSFILTE